MRIEGDENITLAFTLSIYLKVDKEVQRSRFCVQDPPIKVHIVTFL